MKRITCGDLGGDCIFVASGKTDEEVKKKMLSHAKTAHAAVFKMMPKEEIDRRMGMMDEMLAQQK